MRLLLSYILTILVALPGLAVEIKTFFTPYDDAHTEYIKFIHQAKHQVRVAAYGFTDVPIADELVDLHKKGIDVAVVMDSTQAASSHQKPLVRKMRAAGIKVTTGKSARRSQLMHCKFTVVDEIGVEDGSWNYTPSANEQANTATFSDDPERAALYLDFWDEIHDEMEEQKERKRRRKADNPADVDRYVIYEFKLVPPLPPGGLEGVWDDNKGSAI